MFVSSSSNLSFPYNNQTPLENHEHPSSFSPLPDLFVEDDELFLSRLFTQPQILISNSTQTETKPTSFYCGASSTATTRALILDRKSKKQQSSRNRGEKKDKNSKICTSKGLRDRRIRLSLQIARKFFDLQDTLGFDKPSKAIEWLFSKSKSAIKELKEGLPLAKLNCFSDAGMSVSVDEEDPLKKKITQNSREKSGRKIRTVPRELREKARARARERTIEKLMIRDLGKTEDPKFHHEKEEESMFKVEEIMNSEVKEMAELEETPMEDPFSTSSQIFIYSDEIEFSRDSDSREDFHCFVTNWDGTSIIR